MKQILVRITPALARSLERIVPGRGRKRSEFIRNAITKAIMEAEEVHTESAYRRWPQEPMAFDPAAWAAESEAVRFSDEEVREMLVRSAADTGSARTARPAKRARNRRTR